jgi:hypothetical protein
MEAGRASNGIAVGKQNRKWTYHKPATKEIHGTLSIPCTDKHKQQTE